MTTTVENYDYIIRGKYQDQLTGPANKSFDSFKRTGTAAMKGFQIAGVAAIAAVTASLGKMAAETLTLGDKFDKLSKRLGLSVEMLSQLEFAADRSGIQFEAAAKAVQNMQNVLVETAEKGTGPGAEAFARLNLNIKDFIGLPADQALARISTAMGDMSDRSQQVATAVDLFGARGTAMLQIINDGAGGFENLAREADRLGITMSTGAAQAAAEFNDLMSDLWKTVRAFVGQGLQPLIDHVNRNREALEQLARSLGTVVGVGFRAFANMVIVVSNALNTMAAASLAVSGTIFNLISAFSTLTDAVGISENAAQDWSLQADAAFQAAGDLLGRVAEFVPLFEQQTEAVTTAVPAMAQYSSGLSDVKEEADSAAESIEKSADANDKFATSAKKVIDVAKEAARLFRSPAEGQFNQFRTDTEKFVKQFDAKPRSPRTFRDDLEIRVEDAAKKLIKDRENRRYESEFNDLVNRFVDTRSESQRSQLVTEFNYRESLRRTEGLFTSLPGGSSGGFSGVGGFSSSGAGMVVQGDIIVQGSIVSGSGGYSGGGGFGDQARRFSTEQNRQAQRSGGSNNPNGIGTSDTYLGFTVHKPNFTF